MPTLVQQLTLAMRIFAIRPGLALARLLTVTIVVCAVGSVLAVANGSLLRPLPFPDAGAIMRVSMQPPGTTELRDAVPLYPVVFDQLAATARSAVGLEGVWAEDRAVGGDGDPEAVLAGRVSGGFLQMLGGQAALGRLIAPADVFIDARVVVLGHALWMRRYGGDAGVIGRTMLIDREVHSIIGVMPAGFEPAYSRTEFWTPLPLSRSDNPVLFSSVQTIARLRPGVPRAQFQDELDTLLAVSSEAMPVLLKGWAIAVRDFRDAQFGSRRPAILMLLGAVFALTLIAIGNLTNLTLADVLSRRAEFALKAALGASRGGLAGSEITQCLILGAAGAAAGLLASAGLIPALVAMDESAVVSGLDVSMDWRVAAGGALASTVIMLTSMALPTLRVVTPSLARDLAASQARSTSTKSARRTRLVLVGAQTALALALLAAGGLVVTTLAAAARVDPGFEAANVITAQLQLSPAVFPTPLERAVFVERVLAELKATPGVVNAGTTLNPFDGKPFTTGVTGEGRPAPDGQRHTTQYRRVSPGYLETMGIPVVSGRGFDRRDWIDGAPVAIVSAGFAQRFWPEGNAVGARIKRGPATAPWLVVVGVVGDVRDVAAGQAPAATVYTPYFQGSSPATPVALVVRTKGDPLAAAGAVKRAVWMVDSQQPLSHITTLEGFLSASVGQQRFRAMLVSICGVLGLMLATVGVYGVTARAVVERTREVGIRLALGGRPRAVWWTVAWSTLRAVTVGAAAGSLIAASASQGLTTLLPEVAGSIWIFSAGGGAVLLLAGGAASLIAARAVTRVEPLVALRSR